MSLGKRPISDIPETDDESSHSPPNKALRRSNPSQSSTLPYSTSSLTIKAVPFQQPSSLLTFSYTPSHALEFTDSARKYYVDPPKGAALGYRYDKWTRRLSEKGRIDNLLRAWVKTKVPGIEVVSWRGVMTRILTAPYEDREGWELNVMSLNGTMYFEEHLSEARLREKEDMTPRQRLQTYYGYAFESWCTSSVPGRPEQIEGYEKGWSGDVDTNVQWCNVVKTKLGNTRMVIGGEVDCIKGQNKGKDVHLIELKTSMAIRNAQDEARFEKKLLKFYFQSFLLGVPEIIVGFRTPSGQLTTTQSFKTLQIPRMVRSKPGAWDPAIALEWGDRFLIFLKTITKEASLSGTGESDDDADAQEGAKVPVWRVTFKPKEGVNVRLLDEEGVKEVRSGDDEERVGFLPRWFWEETRKGLGTSQEAPNKPEHKGVTTIPPGWQL